MNMEKIVTQRENGKLRVQYLNTKKGLTEQQHENDVNVKQIVARAKKTGYLKQRNDPPRFGDFTTGLDYHTALNAIADAQQEFLTIPAEIRARFDNDLGRMIDYLDLPENLQEAVSDGLLPRPTPEPPEPPSEPETPPEAE